MPTPSVSDIEQGYPEEKDNLDHLLGTGYKPSNSRNLKESQLEPLLVNEPLPPSPTSEDKFFIWPTLYLDHSNDGESGSAISSDLSKNTSDQGLEKEESLPHQNALENSASKTQGNEKKEPVPLVGQDVVKKLVDTGAFLTCWNDEGQTPLHVCVEKRLEDVLETLVRKVGPDVKDRTGKTVLRAAVDADWLPGVRVALSAGADVTLKAPDGKTPLHAAAAGITNSNKNLREIMLNDILTVAEQRYQVNCLNAIGETALFNAVNSGHIWCVRQFLDKGASIKHTAENNLSVFHIAARNGHVEILKTLLDFDEDTTKSMIDNLTIASLGGFAPIHFAVLNNNLLCVKILKSKNADICIKTISTSNELTTPLHIAVDNDNYEIAECILSTDETSVLNKRNKSPKSRKPQLSPIEQFDGKGWLPLHSAIHKGSENFIKLLLKHKASLASQIQSDKAKTALDMIMQHVTNPTEFLEDVLDSYILLDGSVNRVKIDYQLLMSNRGLKEEMEVIEALLKTGNEFKQKKLLLHPLIESFIYLKWWALWPFYVLVAAIYIIFVTLLATFATLVFYKIDTSAKPELPYLLGGGSVILFFIVLQFFQELFMNVEGGRYFLKPENSYKLGSLVLAAVLPLVSIVQGWEEAARHVATGALLLASFQMLTIISQCPSWGYYVVMFKKVTCNVLKILGTFTILYIGFALSFMIQFRSQAPFDNVWHAFVKTLFLKTAEFDYNDVFHPDNKSNTDNADDITLEPNFEAVRVLYVIFLVLVAIVLMNMMVGVAVDDISDLKKHGNIGRLEKQAAFVRSLDTLKYNLTKVILPERYRRNLFPSTIIFEKKTVKRKIFSNIRKMPKRFQDAFFSIAQKNKDKDHVQKVKETKIDEERKKFEKQYNFYDKTTKKLDELEAVTKQNTSQIERINMKLDLLRMECLEIKQVLLSFKEKLDNNASL